MIEIFIHYLTIWRPLGYALVFFSMMFEGDLTLLVISFLARMKFFDFFDVVGFVFAGTVVGDCFWFWLGRKGSVSQMTVVKWLFEKVKFINIDFENYFFIKLFFSKFMYGTHHIAVATVGASKISFKKYILNELPAVALWMTIIGGFGYFLAFSYQYIWQRLKYVEIILFLVIFIYFIANKIYQKFFRDNKNRP
ncbi:MAG: VTT domain-containing protein [bacterium]